MRAQGRRAGASKGGICSWLNYAVLLRLKPCCPVAGCCTTIVLDSINASLAGGIGSIVATGWRVQAARDAVLLETAWGCGGRVRDVLLQGWAVGNGTSDVLRVNARSHACEVRHEEWYMN